MYKQPPHQVLLCKVPVTWQFSVINPPNKSKKPTVTLVTISLLHVQLQAHDYLHMITKQQSGERCLFCFLGAC